MEDHIVIKSAIDKRNYKFITLANELKVLLISSPDAESSAASLSVQAGFYLDSEDVQGLAHFCEHMLFLGTEKYPDEQEYNQYLSTHGGSSNAYTSGDRTNYHFKVNSDYLEGSLDRFSQFFISPLFTQDGTERELHAIDSEHSKNFQNDAWRCGQLLRHTSNPSHPYHKFGTGSAETLKKHANIRELLFEFYDKYYSSNIMTLAISGKNSLEELEGWAKTYFEKIINKNVVVPTYPSPPLTKEYLGFTININPILDLRQISFCFPIPEQASKFMSKPAYIVSHFMGHEGPGSFHAVLNKRGWIVDLVAGPSTSQVDFAFFTVTCVLTQEGLLHMNEITELLFQYIYLLKDSDFSMYFDELQSINTLTFENKEQEPPLAYVEHLTGLMHYYPPEYILSGPYLFYEWNPELIKEVIGFLNPDNLRIMVVSKDFDTSNSLLEPWYKIPYTSTPIDEKLIYTWKNLTLHPELFLPTLNPFVPTNFDRREPLSSHIHEKPKALIEEGKSTLWYQYDTCFKIPKAFQVVEFILPSSMEDAISLVCTMLYCRLFEDSLGEYTYAADIAGLSYSVSPFTHGIRLIIKGYNCKQFVMASTILEKMSSFVPTADRFKVFRDEIQRRLSNVSQNKPYTRAMIESDFVLEMDMPTYSEQLEVIKTLSFQTFFDFVSTKLFEYMYVEYFGMGNLSFEDSKSTLDNIKINFPHTKPITKDVERTLRYVLLPPKTKTIRRVYPENECEKNAAIEIFYKIGVDSVKISALHSLFSQIVSTAAFQQLRTVEQLGYIVHTGEKVSHEVHHFRVIVQSDKYTPSYLTQRVEAWILSVEELLKNLPEEELCKNKESLIARKLEKDKTLVARINRYLCEITFPRRHSFDRSQEIADSIALIKKEDLFNFYHNFIHPHAPERSMLVVEVHANVPLSDKEVIEVENNTEGETSIEPIEPTKQPELRSLEEKKSIELQNVDDETKVVVIEDIKKYHESLDSSSIYSQRFLISKDSPSIDHIMPHF